jgi:hypothetical protein
MPKTFVLPTELSALKTAFDKEGVKKKWIVKPPASARGTGIQVKATKNVMDGGCGFKRHHLFRWCEFLDPRMQLVHALSPINLWLSYYLQVN